MTLLRDIARALASIVLADARQSLAILVLVFIAVSTNRIFGFEPLIGGGILIGGCLLVLCAVCLLEVRR